ELTVVSVTRRDNSSRQCQRITIARNTSRTCDITGTMKLTARIRPFEIAGKTLRARRTAGGVVEIWGDNYLDLQRGLGFFHAHDRQVQMMLVRLIAQGRLCECLKDDDESLAIDIFMRQLGLAATARDEVPKLAPHAREFAQAYADGVN